MMKPFINIPLPKGKVLLQLSGGKDSMACLLFLMEHHIDFEAIHFIHDYGYSIPTENVKDICKSKNITLHVIDITKNLTDLFLNGFNQRPCRFCKSVMDEITIKTAIQNRCTFICVGDTADDSMLINRIKRAEQKLSYFSRYFNQKVILPAEISIYRPLLNITGMEALQYVISLISDFKRVNDTGDKYFEYSREGCPLQFKDIGVPYSISLMKRLKKYNQLCSEFATKKGIKASIHLPSEFIVTIPRGFEKECKEYLLNNGCHLISQTDQRQTYLYSINVKCTFIDYLNVDLQQVILQRFVERCGFQEEQIYLENTTTTLIGKGFSLKSYIHENNGIIVISIASSKCLKNINMENICIELFHTYDFTIMESVL